MSDETIIRIIHFGCVVVRCLETGRPGPRQPAIVGDGGRSHR